LYVPTEIGNCLGQIVFPSGTIPQSTALEIALTRNKKRGWITSTKSPWLQVSEPGLTSWESRMQSHVLPLLLQIM